MTYEDKMICLEDMIDADTGSLTPDTLLSDIDEWDSMAVIALIAVSDDKFNKKITKDQIKCFNKVNDIIDFWSL